MPNKVLTIFEGDPQSLFTTADAVEARLKKVQAAQQAAFQPNNSVASAQGPSPATPALDRVIQAQRDLTKTVETESAKRANAEITAAKAVTKTVETEIAKQRSLQQSANPLNPSSSARLSELGIRASSASPAASASAPNNAAQLETFRQSIKGYDDIGAAAANAAGKATLLNAAVGALPPEIQAAVSIAGGLPAPFLAAGVAVAAVVVPALAILQAVKDIEAAAQKRLATEIAVTAEWNKQHSVLGDIQTRLKEMEDQRNFNRFIGGASLGDLGSTRNAVQAQLDASQKAVTDEFARRQLLLARNPGLGADYVAGASGTPEEKGKREALQKQLGEQLVQIDAQIFTERQRLSDDFRDRQLNQIRSIAKLERDQIATSNKIAVEAGKLAVEAAKKRAAEAEKEKKRIEELIEARKKLTNDIRSSFVGFASQSNPYVKIYDDAAQAITRVDQLSKGLSANIRNGLQAAAKEASNLALSAERAQNGLQVQDLQDRARNLRRGYNAGDEDEITKRAKAQLFPVYNSQEEYDRALEIQKAAVRGQDTREQQDDLSRRLKFLSGSGLDPTVANQEIIRATQGFKPGELNSEQRDLAARANEAEARRRLEMGQKAVAFYDAVLALIDKEKGLKVNLQDQAVTSVEIKSRDITAEKKTAPRSVYGRGVSTSDAMLP